MRKELREKLFIDFPEFFRLRGKLGWLGFSCGSGWEPILRKLCEDVKNLNESENFTFVQIKEKFGGLRVHGSGQTKEICDLFRSVCKESYKTCESCGSKKDVETTDNGGHWIFTLCKNCWRKKENGEPLFL